MLERPIAGRRSSLPEVTRLLPESHLTTLDNGLTVVVVPSSRAPIVATALAFRAGTRDEVAGLGGTAHFLEHMMFKGARRFGAGEIDRLTQSLGGSNNAFTSHDLTLYYFTLSADRWTWALDVEADRMAGLILDRQEVESERRVILEEISMYESEPWDALGEAVHERFFVDHPYGLPVLGKRSDLAAIDADVLRAFHRRHYRPDNAVMAVVGDVDPERAVAEVASRFESFSGAGHSASSSARRRPGPHHRSDVHRVERRVGELARLLWAVPAPAGGHPDHPPLRLLLSILGSGRCSRLHRALVDEGQRCVWVAADLQEGLDAGMVSLAAEAVPGADPQEIEAEIGRRLAELRRRPPSQEELDRARRMEIADWLFGHEKVDQMAFLAATSGAVFDLDHPVRYLERMCSATPEDLLRVANTYLDPSRASVVGWSLPS